MPGTTLALGAMAGIEPAQQYRRVAYTCCSIPQPGLIIAGDHCRMCPASAGRELRSPLRQGEAYRPACFRQAETMQPNSIFTSEDISCIAALILLGAWCRPRAALIPALHFAYTDFSICL